MLHYCISTPDIAFNNISWKHNYINYPCGGFNLNYPKATKTSTVLIKVHTHFFINLTIEHFDIDWSQTHCYDSFVNIVYNLNKTAISQTFCGTLVPFIYPLPTYEAKVIFRIVNPRKVMHFIMRYIILFKYQYSHMANQYNISKVDANESGKLFVEVLLINIMTRTFYNKQLILRGQPGDIFTVHSITLQNSKLKIFDGPFRDYKLIELNRTSHNAKVFSKYFICLFLLEYGADKAVMQFQYVTQNQSFILLNDLINRKINVKQTHNRVVQSVYIFNNRLPHSGKLTFQIKQFNGYANENCQFGGLRFQYESPDMWRGEKIEKFISKVELACTREDGHLFLSSTKELILTSGRSYFIFYSYGNYFTIDLMIRITPSQCEGIINGCEICKIASTKGLRTGQGQYFSIHCLLILNQTTVNLSPKYEDRCTVVQSSVLTNSWDKCTLLVGMIRTEGGIDASVTYLSPTNIYLERICFQNNMGKLKIIYYNSTLQVITFMLQNELYEFKDLIYLQIDWGGKCSFYMPTISIEFTKTGTSQICPIIYQDNSNNTSYIDSKCIHISFYMPNHYSLLFYYRSYSEYSYFDSEIEGKGLTYELEMSGYCDEKDYVYILTDSYSSFNFINEGTYTDMIVVTFLKLSTSNNYTVRIYDDVAALTILKKSSSNCTIRLFYSVHDYIYVPTYSIKHHRLDYSITVKLHNTNKNNNSLFLYV